MIRTESDIILASNLSQELSNLVIAYLELYKKHAQGINGVKVPTVPYYVQFVPMKREGYVSVYIIYTKTETWQEATYYDVDDDNFVESYCGDANISGYTYHSSEYHSHEAFDIPFRFLLQSKENMEKSVIATATKAKAKAAEEERQRKIKTLEAELQELKNTDKK